MNNVTSILFEEKQRLENCVALSRERLLQVSAPAMVQRPQKNLLTGEDVMVSYIELDRFTPEQREQFDIHTKRFEEHKARLCVFDTFVETWRPKESELSYLELFNPLKEYDEVEISCNEILLDEKFDFREYSIKVGPMLVKSPERMSFDRYRKLYTSNLERLLARSLGFVELIGDARKQLMDACGVVYMEKYKKNKSSKSL